MVSDLSSTEDGSSGSDSFGLKSCESVTFDIRDVPGVSFVRDGKPDWTPVVSLSKRKRQKRKERVPIVTLIISTLWLMKLQEVQEKIKVGTSTQLWTPNAAIQERATNPKLLPKNHKNTINIVCFNILCMHVFLLALFL